MAISSSATPRNSTSTGTRSNSESTVQTTTVLLYLPFSLTFYPDWAQHGISGRGVLLDLVNFFTEGGTKPLPYDPWTTHAITPKDLEACATKQGVTFRQGDILIMRVGFMQKWWAVSRAEREALSERPETL